MYALTVTTIRGQLCHLIWLQEKLEQNNRYKLPLVQAHGLPSSLLPSVHPSSLNDSTAGRFNFPMVEQSSYKMTRQRWCSNPNPNGFGFGFCYVMPFKDNQQLSWVARLVSTCLAACPTYSSTGKHILKIRLHTRAILRTYRTLVAQNPIFWLSALRELLELCIFSENGSNTCLY